MLIISFQIIVMIVLKLLELLCFVYSEVPIRTVKLNADTASPWKHNLASNSSYTSFYEQLNIFWIFRSRNLNIISVSSLWNVIEQSFIICNCTPAPYLYNAI